MDLLLAVEAAYERPLRYGVPLYGYRGVVGAVDELGSLGLIEHDRRPPGIRGWQSSVCPHPEFPDIVRTALDGNRPTLQPLRKPILLRNIATRGRRTACATSIQAKREG
jgi:hypothetical protein